MEQAQEPRAAELLFHKLIPSCGVRTDCPAGTPIPLIFRIATVDDAKASDRVPSRRLWVSASGGARGGGQQRPRGGQQQQQQQQQGYEEEDGEGGRQQRGRGNRRYKQRRGGRPAGWQHDDRGAEEGGEGGEGGAEGDAEMTEQQRRRQRRPRTKRRRGGDVDMADAEGAGYGGEVRGGLQASPACLELRALIDVTAARCAVWTAVHIPGCRAAPAGDGQRVAAVPPWQRRRAAGGRLCCGGARCSNAGGPAPRAGQLRRSLRWQACMEDRQRRRRQRRQRQQQGGRQVCVYCCVVSQLRVCCFASFYAAARPPDGCSQLCTVSRLWDGCASTCSWLVEQPGLMNEVHQDSFGPQGLVHNSRSGDLASDGG